MEFLTGKRPRKITNFFNFIPDDVEDKEQFSVLYNNNVHLQSENEELRESVKNLVKKFNDLKERFENDSESYRMNEKLEMQEDELEKRKEEMNEAKTQIRALLGENRHLEKEISSGLQVRVEELIKKLRSSNNKNLDLTLQCNELRKMNDELEMENDDLRLALQQLYAKVNKNNEIKYQTPSILKKQPLKDISKISLNTTVTPTVGNKGTNKFFISPSTQMNIPFGSSANKYSKTFLNSANSSLNVTRNMDKSMNSSIDFKLGKINLDKDLSRLGKIDFHSDSELMNSEVNLLSPVNFDGAVSKVV